MGRGKGVVGVGVGKGWQRGVALLVITKMRMIAMNVLCIDVVNEWGEDGE